MRKLLYRGGARNAKLIRLCFLRALKKGYRMFGVENHSECWSGRRAHKTYFKYGRSRRCRKWTGGRWALDVYRIGTGKEMSSGVILFVLKAWFPLVT